MTEGERLLFPREELEQKEKSWTLGNSWAGRDLSMELTQEDRDGNGFLVGHESGEARVMIDKNSFPPNIDLDNIDLENIDLSTRSYLAQAGVVIDLFKDTDDKYRQNSLTQKDLEKIKKGEEVEIIITMAGLTGNCFDFSNEIGRLYHMDEQNQQQGDGLLQLIKDGKFNIGGIYGENYCLIDEQGNQLAENETEKAHFVRLFLTSKRLEIPIYPPEEVVKLRSKKDLEMMLREYKPNSQAPHFHLRETHPVKLAENLAGLIKTYTPQSAFEKGIDPQHINSPLIDPGFSGSIRTEFVGETEPEFVDMELYSA